MRQHCKPTTSLAHALLHAHTWHFLHFRPFRLRLRVLPHALHIISGLPFSLVLRLIMSHVLNSCVGVKHIPGASGESREVSAPSPEYPHVWSKQAGQSPRVRARATQRHDAKNCDAPPQELAYAGMIAQARCDSARSSVCSGFIVARADTTFGPARAGLHAASAGAAVRVFFCGGVIGVFPVAAFRALDTVDSTDGPPGACASSKSAISSASSSSRSHSSALSS